MFLIVFALLGGILIAAMTRVSGQWKQTHRQFRSNLIAIVALLGDDGIRVFRRPKAEMHRILALEHLLKKRSGIFGYADCVAVELMLDMPTASV